MIAQIMHLGDMVEFAEADEIHIHTYVNAAVVQVGKNRYVVNGKNGISHIIIYNNEEFGKRKDQDETGPLGDTGLQSVPERPRNTPPKRMFRRRKES